MAKGGNFVPVDRPVEYVNDITAFYGSRVEGARDFPFHTGSWFNNGILEAPDEINAHVITSVYHV